MLFLDYGDTDTFERSKLMFLDTEKYCDLPYQVRIDIEDYQGLLHYQLHYQLHYYQLHIAVSDLISGVTDIIKRHYFQVSDFIAQ